MNCDPYVAYIKELHREIETLEHDLYQQKEENHRMKENVQDVLYRFKKIIIQRKETLHIRHSQDLERDYKPTGVYHRLLSPENPSVPF
jgi:glutathione peroxidase-family protein